MEYAEIKTAMEAKTQEILNLARKAYDYDVTQPLLFNAVRHLLQELENPQPMPPKTHGLYAKEFDADRIFVPQFLFGRLWEDVSWHNDVCPRFQCTAHMLAVWVDFDDPAERELNCLDGPYEENVWKKYNVVKLIQDEDGYTQDSDTLFGTEDADELQKWLINYAIEKGE